MHAAVNKGASEMMHATVFSLFLEHAGSLHIFVLKGETGVLQKVQKLKLRKQTSILFLIDQIIRRATERKETQPLPLH